MRTALIGYSGFVGSNLKDQFDFDDFYNSKNIYELKDREMDSEYIMYKNPSVPDEILKYEEQFVKLSSIDNIGKFENIEITKESTQMFNTDPQVLKLNALGDTPNNICVKLLNDHCIANMNYLFKKLYLYKMEKSGITIGFFILSDVDLTTENFKILLGNVNFQNKVKELVCGEGNVDDCNIF